MEKEIESDLSEDDKKNKVYIAPKITATLSKDDKMKEKLTQK
jgi:hypothetical protein